MTIKEAGPNDVPEIIKVLKASLGKKEVPFSEKIWNYKHLDNPFGKSIVLIAVEDKNVIGVRAFMRWQWHKEDNILSCFRAVDTATHPNHQGKGVFKKLTLAAVELAKEEGGAFIFNTPNEKSRPGYLKMGWEIAGKISVGLSPALYSFWKIKKNIPAYEVHYQTSVQKIDDLCTGWNKELNRGNLYTEKSASYLKWRYEDNPLQEYEVLATANFYLAGYIKKRKGFKELRIVECIYNDRANHKELNEKIKQWSLKFGAQVISFSPLLGKLILPSLKGKLGPLLTVRNLNLSKADEKYFSIEKWTFSLGDLELF